MSFRIEAACMCSTGKVRKNNEDNFYFDGRCLPSENNGLRNPVVLEQKLTKELCLAVFDGMGGENYGELASFEAAKCLKETSKILLDYVIREREFLEKLCAKLNMAVVNRAHELCTEQMGCTMASLFFNGDIVYMCNVGDSRVYRLRNGMFQQLSTDDVQQFVPQGHKKAPLTQYLGVDPEMLLIEPNIAKGELESGDCYLICSDGLTDMLTNLEITEILGSGEDAQTCAAKLVQAALDNGGRDNVTAIVCRIK